MVPVLCSSTLCLLLVGLLPWSALTLVSARGNATADEVPVVLPPFVLVESRNDARPWLYARADDIEVLTKLSEEESRDYSEGFIYSERMLTRIVPAAIWARSTKPPILVMCAADAKTANADALRRIDLRDSDDLFEHAGPPTDAFAAAQRFLLRRNNSNAELQLVSYYDRESTVFFNRRVDPDQSTVNFSAGNQGADVLLGRSLYRMLMDHRAPPLPAWLAEGLPALIAASHLNAADGRWAIDPFVVWPTRKGTIAPVIRGKTVPVCLPLDEIFGVPPPRDSRRFPIWSYQSALFVRWAVFQKRGLWSFVTGIREEGVSEKLFKRCFGCSHDEALQQMRTDFKNTAGALSLRVNMPEPKPTLEFRRATDLEIRRIVADLARLQSASLKRGHPKLANDCLSEALGMLAKNKGGADKDAETMAVWGLCALEAGQTAKARECLEAMDRLSEIPRPFPYLALARLRFEESREQWEVAKSSYSPAEVEPILAPLWKSMGLRPALREQFELLLDVLERTHLALDDKGLATLRSATTLFPEDKELRRRVEAAVAAVKAGQGSAGR